MLKKYLTIFLCILSFAQAQTQNTSDVFHFLELPFSSRVSALGGENISVIEDDITLAIHNPALLSYITDKTLNLNYMSYMEGTNVGSASFGRLLGSRSSWAVAGQYVDYGEMKETTEENIEVGTFQAKDINIAGMFTYDLSDYWSGGVKTNLIYSHYDKYNSFAIGVDLGLNYYNDISNFSFSVVARNLGAQIVSFEDKRENLPVNLQLGISKMLSHAPFRFSATLHQLTKWKNSSEKKPLNHIVLGVDYIPTNNFYVSLGYNFKRGNDMKVNGSSHWAGFSGGAGIKIKRIRLGVAYAKYHVSASSIITNLSFTL